MTTMTDNQGTGLRSCHNCGLETDPMKSFCPRCGEHVGRIDGLESKSGGFSTQRQSLAEAAAVSCPEIKSARSAIMTVAVLTLLFAGVLWWLLGTDSVQSAAKAEQLADAKGAVKIVAAFGVLFIGLFFWAKTHPFAATLTALLIYGGEWLVSACMNPETASNGIFIKIIIIMMLAKGVKAGWEYNQIVRHGD